MKRLLMIAYLYPPIAAVGKNRTLRFERHLRAFGYEPIIHTVRNPDRYATTTSASVPPTGAVVHRSHAVNLGWLASGLGWTANKLGRLAGRELERNPLRKLLFVPDVHVGWIPGCVAASVRLVRRHHVSAIYVTCSPFSAVISGLLLKRLTGLPLVLDFRDPWSFNDHNIDAPHVRYVIERLERRALRACDAFIANTDTAADRYRELYPDRAHVVSRIYNGVNTPPVFERLRPSVFTLLYTGIVYDARYLELLFDGARLAFPDGAVRFEFTGPDRRLVERVAAQYQMGDRVRCHGYVDIVTLQRLYGRSSALLFYNGFRRDGSLATTVVKSKLFDYLAAGLPIFALASGGEASTLLHRYASNATVVHEPQVGAFASALRVLRERWASGALEGEPRDAFLQDFGGEALTRQLAGVLDRVTTQTAGPGPGPGAGPRPQASGPNVQQG